MFGLSFLFAAALWVLPLAGLPVLLHMLFRRKSPLVPFSTLRFIKSSIQQTAARKKVQRWMLLACRMLLLALLIWAISQPAKIMASKWFNGGSSLIAAVVVDTSYSMQLQEQQVPLLDRSNEIVRDLLRGQLRDARVAVFRSMPAPADRPEQFESASKVAAEWVPLKPDPSPQPLIERIGSAIDLLKRQPAQGKWLIVLTDLQSKEFPRPMAELEGIRTIFMDLHPQEARSAGVARVKIEPEQPIPGITSEATIEVVGRGGTSRAALVTVSSLDGRVLLSKPPLMANFDAGGRAYIRFPLEMPAERWVLLTGSLQGEDEMNWDNTRSQLIEVPPRQIVTLLDTPAGATPTPAERFIRLALDPTEGNLKSWPLEMKRNATLSGQENAVVAPLVQWPEESQAIRLRDYAKNGGVVVVCVRPGLEELWPQLTARQKNALSEILPSDPQPAPAKDMIYHGSPSGTQDPVMNNLLAQKAQVESLIVKRFVPFATGEKLDVRSLLNISPETPGPGAKSFGLLFKRKVGSGIVYTLATMPESYYTNMATHSLFLPMMVNMCLRPPGQSDAQNIELGNPLVVAGMKYASLNQVEVHGPGKEVYVIKPTVDGNGRRFVFDQAAVPGIYTWHKQGSNEILAVSNVQLPSSESDLTYRPADTIATSGPDMIIARSMPDLESIMTKVSEPEPKWSGAIAVVLFLMCLEALMGSLSNLWKPVSWKSYIPGLDN